MTPKNGTKASLGKLTQTTIIVTSKRSKRSSNSLNHDILSFGKNSITWDFYKLK